MVLKVIAWIFLFVIHVNQEAFTQINCLFTDGAQQKTNYYFYKSSSGLIFYSSSDGLVTFDGHHTRIYHSATHGMHGSNIQSSFFEDIEGRIWFTTYQALHVFDPDSESFQYFFIRGSNGKNIEDNYKAISIIGNNIYLKAGNQLYMFDLKLKQEILHWNVDLTEQNELSIFSFNGGLMLFASGYRTYKLCGIKSDGTFEVRDSKNIGVSAHWLNNDELWLGGTNGKLYQYKLYENRIVNSFDISTASIQGIIPYTGHQICITYQRDAMTLFSIDSLKVSGTFQFIAEEGCIIGQALLRPYMDSDSILWIGSSGQGVFYFNLHKIKFKHVSAATDITKILPYSSDEYILLTRQKGILHINSQGYVIHDWSRLPSGESQFSVRTGAWIEENKLLFTSNFKPYVLNLGTGIITSLTFSGVEGSFSFTQLDKISNGKVIASLDTSFLYEVRLHGNHIELKPYFSSVKESKLLLNFKEDATSNLYISNDEKNILVYKYNLATQLHQFAVSLLIPGGVRSISDQPENTHLYLTNTNGIYRIKKEDFSYEHLVDEEKLLAQTIYTSHIDKENVIWLGTNKGLINFDLDSLVVHQFSSMDGVQGMEYNSHASLLNSDGHMLFGGVNGLNYFHPKDVKLSTKPAPVYFSELLINDVYDSTYRAPQYVEMVDLKYMQNTISFEFHAIDYSDPAATRVKYKLIGVDDEYIESKSAQGFARYANLRPRNYTFSILGQNADGVWNESPRELPIIIHPPFWLTWWFISLSSLTMISLIYWTVRSYYRRKLEKKNLLLREQALIIKNQQAIEHERTRIASEMHDDLGSGLTTIRYLSDKALMQAKDTEEVEQIQRIADHSNTLVRNMSEIIWAMNSRFDDAENLAGYLRRYASEYLEEHSIPFSFDIDDEQLENVNVRGEVRRNLFLVFKEVLHNTVKYSGATEVIIHLHIDDHVTIKVSEIGARGFDPISSEEKGNGLYNTKKRMDAIQGRIAYEKSAEAMHIIFSAPIHLT